MLLFSNSHDVLFTSQMGEVCGCRMVVLFVVEHENKSVLEPHC